MRVFIAVLVLIFSLQSWTKAEDIRDFQIEGMSIGDSALDFFTKYEIENALDTGGYKSDKFIYYFLLTIIIQQTIPDTYPFYLKVPNILSLGPGLEV